MRSYTVGRDLTCNIIIKDPQNVISRTHAIINVAENGKITIIDQSRNGTYVNGIRISSHVMVPVTRQDKVTFAQSATLDWTQIPNGFAPQKIIMLSIGIVVGVSLILVLAFLVPWNNIFSKQDIYHGAEPIPTPLVISNEGANEGDASNEMEESGEAERTTTTELEQEQDKQDIIPFKQTPERNTSPTKQKGKKKPIKQNNKQNNVGGSSETNPNPKEEVSGNNPAHKEDVYEIPD